MFKRKKNDEEEKIWKEKRREERGVEKKSKKNKAKQKFGVIKLESLEVQLPVPIRSGFRYTNGVFSLSLGSAFFNNRN